MIMNMGPQHPSTTGWRLMLELQGETVAVQADVGYLHNGMEKTAETLTYAGRHQRHRMDYLSLPTSWCS